MHSKFLSPLPSTAEEFVASVNKCFPYIIDTKVLLNQSSVLQQRMKKSSSTLSSAFEKLCPHIALGSSKVSNLVVRSSVKVEVQVDDTRFASTFFSLEIILNAYVKIRGLADLDYWIA